MPITPSTGVPNSFTQGDTVSFIESFADYPSTDWSLKFCMVRNGLAITPIEASASGTDFAVIISADDSAKIVPGNYVYSEIVTNIATSERLTIKTGSLIVSPDPTASLEQSTNAKILAGLKSAMLSLSTGTNEKVNINGQEFTKKNLETLQKTIDRYQIIVDGELRELGLDNKGGARTLQTFFAQ